MKNRRAEQRIIKYKIKESISLRSLTSRAVFLLLAIFFLAGLNAALAHPHPTSQKDVGISVTIEGTPGPTPTPPPGGGGVATLPTVVVFEGMAYPSGLITVLKNGSVASTFIAEPSGIFKRSLTGLSSGIYTFGIYGEDSEGRESVTSVFTINVWAGTTMTISGIVLSPTISLVPALVPKGQDVIINGQAFPESNIKIFLEPDDKVKTTIVGKDGKWSYRMETNSLKEGIHEAKAMTLTQKGEQSPFSQTLSFNVLRPGVFACRGADLNFDGLVNLVDFSILLFYWDQNTPANRCADINSDGIVDIIDFSIMMYEWTK